jgi:hypothetical protein
VEETLTVDTGPGAGAGGMPPQPPMGMGGGPAGGAIVETSIISSPQGLVHIILNKPMWNKYSFQL